MGFLEVASWTREAEMDKIKSTIHTKDISLKSLEEEKRLLEEESTSSQKLHEKKLKECEVLHGQVKKLEQQCKEQVSTINRLEKTAAASEQQQQQVETEALKREVAQQKLVAELEKFLETSKSTQDNAIEKLKRELLDSGKELAQSREDASEAEKELDSMHTLVQETGKSEEKEQMSQCLQVGERKTSLISSLEQEMSIMHWQLVKEAESKDLRRLVLTESEKSKNLEERLRLLQSEMAMAACRAAERCSTMKVKPTTTKNRQRSCGGLPRLSRKT